jgi:hypothetical protein
VNIVTHSDPVWKHIRADIDWNCKNKNSERIERWGGENKVKAMLRLGSAALTNRRSATKVEVKVFLPKPALLILNGDSPVCMVDKL